MDHYRKEYAARRGRYERMPRFENIQLRKVTCVAIFCCRLQRSARITYQWRADRISKIMLLSISPQQIIRELTEGVLFLNLSGTRVSR